MKILQLENEEIVRYIAGEDIEKRNRALKTLYNDPIVLHKVKAMVNDYNLTRKTADDILQEGVILVDNIIRKGGFKGESKVSTFLLAVCRNLIRDANKKVDRIEWRETIQDYDLKKLDEVGDLSGIELKELNNEERQRDEALMKVLGEMSEKCKEAIMGYYFKNMSMEQLANARGLANKEQAKKAVYRCRNQLREAIVNNPLLSKILNL
jgi:RNA polymerase sigma factor (sigma-70 family)